MVAEDVDLDEVHHRAVGDAVVNVAQRAGKDQRQRDGGEGEAVAQADQDNEHHQRRQRGEADQPPADRVGRGGVGEEREGRAVVGPMGDAQKVRDHRDGAAHGNAQRDPGLGQPVKKDDRRRR